MATVVKSFGINGIDGYLIVRVKSKSPVESGQNVYTGIVLV
jgi:hypothetical protein